MDRELIIALLNNAALMIALNMIYTFLPRTKTSNKIQPTVQGILAGAICIIVMLSPIQLAPGVILDTRSIVITLTGAFLGGIPVLITILMTTALRIYQGGAGALTGVMVIASSGALGLVFHYYRLGRLKKNQLRRIVELYILGVTVHIIMLLCFFAIKDDALKILKSIYLQVIILYPIGTVLLGLLFFKQKDNLSKSLKLEETEEELRRTLMAIGDGVITVDSSGNIANINPVAEKFTGWLHAEAQGRPFTDIFKITNEVTGGPSRNPVEAVLKTGKVCLLENHTVLTSKNGDRIYISDSAAPIKDNTGKITGVIIIFSDVSDRKRSEKKIKESESRLNRSQAIAHIGSWELDLKTKQIWSSKEAFAIYGIVQDSPYINQDKVKQFTDKKDRTKLERALQKLIANNDEYDVEFMITTNNGVRKFISSKAYLNRDVQNNPIKVIGIIQDITNIKLKEQELVHINYHDHLTGLYNRRFFEEELSRLDVSRNYPLTIIIGDANGLKLINDSLGHDKGDELLIKIADVLKLCCRNDEIIARLGGDEFVILLPNTTPAEAETIINRIDSSMANETIDNIDLSASFSYSTKNDSSTSIDKIFKEAEDNMYKIKMLEAPSRRSKTIDVFKTTLFEKDIKSEEHSERVSEYATKLAKAYKMNAAAIAEIKTAGLLHDIGKIMTPDEVLNKIGVLDRSEWLEIKKHPASGYRILSSLGGMGKIAEYILNHHERIDGKGYPGGLTGENISIQSKIISIADSYDAMSSVRSYKDPLTKEEIIDELKNNSGTQFDSILVELFINEILQKEDDAKE
jgi:diguanylate cyclase (GGDEF)-like protein/PAS domain S-box-containing protein/putative nucleotidyltransferase with HDIG domain